jgi:hypothetical protein
MVCADPTDKGLTSKTATAAGLFLSSDNNHVHFARVASTAAFGSAPGSLED